MKYDATHKTHYSNMTQVGRHKGRQRI